MSDVDAKANAAREASQKKTFTRWANHYMAERMLKINDLFVDLKDGILLINLMELISSKNLGRYEKRPRMELQMLGNIDVALKFITSEGIKLVNIGPKDIYIGNPKLILGLIWTLILRYQINLGDSSPKQELINWVNKQIKPYQKKGVDPIVNFTSSLQDGKALAALADSLSPGLTEIDTDDLADALKNVQNCLTVSERDYNIPPLLDAVDVVNNPDEHSAMTYISYFRDYLENKAKDSNVYKTKGAHAESSYVTGRGVGEKGKGNLFRGRAQPFVIHSKNVGGEYVTTAKWKCVYTVQVTGPNGPVQHDMKDMEDGTYQGCYVPDTVGEFKISVVQEGKYGIPDAHVRGSVFSVNVLEGADPSKSYAEGPGLTNAFDDAPATFTVHCLDYTGTPVAGEDTLAVVIEPIKRDGAALEKKAAAPPPAKVALCEHCGDKLVPGKKFCEHCGSKVPAGPPAAAAAVRPGTIVPKIKDNGDGTYSVEYLAPIPGDYDLNVTVDNQAIKDMPSKLKVHRGIDASKTYAEGRGVNSPGFLGREHPFTVHTVDRDGKELKSGGGTFKTTVSGPSGPIPCTLKDNGDGTYSGSYIPKELGNHVVDIKLNKGDHLEPIKGNPFKLTVKKPADLSKSYAEGEGVHNAADNRPGKFKVFAKDEDGKPVSGEWLDVKITPKGDDPKGQSIFPVDIKDNGDGTYDVQYEAKDVGDYNMNVEIAESPIKDMPTGLHVHAGVDPSKCVVEGPGVEGGPRGKDLPFIVRAMDKQGKPVNFGGDDFKVQVVGPDGKKVPCELKDNGDGTYSGHYVPQSTGIYTVDLTVNDNPTHVGKAPYKCKVRAGTGNSYAEGPGLAHAFDDVPGRFTVHCFDTDGKPVAGEDSLAVSILLAKKLDVVAAKPPPSPAAVSGKCSDCGAVNVGKKFCESCGSKLAAPPPPAAASPASRTENPIVSPVIKDNNDGTYAVEYKATVAGEYDLNIVVDNASIKDMPSKLKVHRGIDASKTYAEGRGVNSPGFLGREHPFTVHTVDRDGNKVNVGGAEFKVSVNGPHGPIACELKDNGDGTYSGNYTPKELGNHVVDIKLNKGDRLEPIKGNPFKLTVKKPADLSKSYAEGEGVHNAADNRPGKFKVFAKDEDGKPVSGEWLDVKITPKGDDPKGQSLFPVDIKDNGDGTYDVQYEAKDVGDYNMNVEIAESPIKDMPTGLHVHAGLDPSKCVVEGPGVEGGLANRDLPFTVHAKDGNGKPVKFGGDDFKVEVVGPDGKKVPCELKDNGDGTYSGSYHPNAPGDYTVDLTVNDNPTHVGKAPYKCKVKPAGDASKSYAKGKGWRYCYDNQPASFKVYVKDAKGQPVSGEVLHVAMSDKTSQQYKDALAARIAKVDPYMLKKKADQYAATAVQTPQDLKEGDVPTTVTDNHDGTYTVNYTAIIPGEYEMNVQVQGKPIKDAPKVIKCLWSCPNEPCAHTMEELHQQLAEQRDQIYQLQKKVAQLSGTPFEERGYDNENDP